jgi:endonuclease/exonuclease/phosphatase family metal-dependent hydrolase
MDRHPNEKIQPGVRRAIGLALLAAATACSAHTQEAAPEASAPLKVMSFNIRYGTAPDGNHVWALRRPVLMKVIGEFDPHVLGVQEALRFQLDEMTASLSDYVQVGAGRDDGRTAGEYSAILYDTTRLALLEHRTFWLSDTPEVPGSMTWGNRYVRIVTWARFRDRASGQHFYVFNTHWDHESQPARERSAQLLLERIAARRPPDPILVMGDFNAGEDNPAFRAVGTYHAFRGDSTGARIDAILAGPGWQVEDASIVRFAEAGRFPSDHFPVTAIMRRQSR